LPPALAGGIILDILNGFSQKSLRILAKAIFYATLIYLQLKLEAIQKHYS
jgi:hypothetical protein